VPSAGNRDVNITYDIGLTSGANVRIAKSGPATALPGQAVSYALNYANDGPAAADNVTVVDTLPSGVSFVSASPPPSSVSGQTITWNFGTLGSGASGSISVTVQSSSALTNGTQLTNQVQITTTTAGDNPGDNGSSVTTTGQRADVAVTKSSPNIFPLASGQQVTYYLDFTNLGPAVAANVVLADVAPPQITGVSWSCTSGCSGSGTGNSISINLGTLAASATGRVTVTGTAQTTVAREDFINTATISTSTPETNTTNNQSSVPGAVWTTDHPAPPARDGLTRPASKLRIVRPQSQAVRELDREITALAEQIGRLERDEVAAPTQEGRDGTTAQLAGLRSRLRGAQDRRATIRPASPTLLAEALTPTGPLEPGKLITVTHNEQGIVANGHMVTATQTTDDGSRVLMTAGGQVTLAAADAAKLMALPIGQALRVLTQTAENPSTPPQDTDRPVAATGTTTTVAPEQAARVHTVPGSARGMSGPGARLGAVVNGTSEAVTPATPGPTIRSALMRS